MNLLKNGQGANGRLWFPSGVSDELQTYVNAQQAIWDQAHAGVSPLSVRVALEGRVEPHFGPAVGRSLEIYHSPDLPPGGDRVGTVPRVGPEGASGWSVGITITFEVGNTPVQPPPH